MYHCISCLAHRFEFSDFSYLGKELVCNMISGFHALFFLLIYYCHYCYFLVLVFRFFYIKKYDVEECHEFEF